ncbi:MAG: DUF488 domain-containing protein, partial [Nitrososphaerota archaeon]|nr:DUF488 domain-containing protein [Nitrososphaerota archaeon]
MIDHSSMKLGKKPAVHDPRTLLLANYLKPKLPRIPAEKNWGRKVKRWHTMKNTGLADCTIAATGHLILEWTAHAGKAVLLHSDATSLWRRSFRRSPFRMEEMMSMLYTIGHSTLRVEDFIRLLRLHDITALADVRSQPYSRANPQFNREALQLSLQESGIKYVFLGPELGARSEDESCFDEGKVQYERLSKTALFQSGLERVKKGMQDYRIALMCAEKDPLDCHRTILISRCLEELGVNVQHIHSD